MSQFSEMEKKLKYFQRENELLKERAQNIEILREENNTLRASIENKDQIMADYHKMKVCSIQKILKSGSRDVVDQHNFFQ